MKKLFKLIFFNLIQLPKIFFLNLLSPHLLFALIFLPLFTQGQSTYYLEQWDETTGLTNDFAQVSVSITDAQNNLYVATSSLNGLADNSSVPIEYYYDITLKKYSEKGSEEWTKEFNLGSKSAFLADLKLDDNQNPIIAGSVYDDNSQNYEGFVAKYNSSGTFQWHQLFGGTANEDDGAKEIFTWNNDVFVVGSISNNNTQFDLITSKYNSSGVLQWSKEYNQAGLNDAALIISGNNTVMTTTGIVETSFGTYEQVTISYNNSNGAIIQNATTQGIIAEIQEVNDVIIDGSGNIYITGAAQGNQAKVAKTLKLNPQMQVEWTQTFQATGSVKNVGNAITLDNNGNVYITGYSNSNNQNTQLLSVKYSNTGAELWSKSMTEGVESSGNDILVNSNNEVFISGYSRETSTDNTDFKLIQLDANGNEVWKTSFNGIYNKDDKASKINIDTEGNILVSGNSTEISGNTTFMTVKYNKHELVLPPNDNPLLAFNYLENKGQLKDENGINISKVKFYNQQEFPNLFFSNDMVSMVVSNIDTVVPTPDTMHRVDLIFNNRADVRARMRVAPLNEKEVYFNYFLSHIPEGRSKVRAFDNMVYSDIYDNIDLVYSSNSRGSKFYVICKPGSDPTDIEWIFDGYDNLTIGTSNELLIGTSLSEIVFPQPIAFQIDGNGNEVSLNWQPSFNISNDEVSFSSIGNYNSSMSLVFELTKNSNTILSNTFDDEDWVTVLRNNSLEEALDVFVLDKGNEEEAVGVFGTAMSPIFPSATDITTTFGSVGFISTFIASYDEIGRLIWLTMVGGSSWGEIREGMISNVGGEISYYAVGRTVSEDFPQTVNSFQGQEDGFIYKLSENGQNLEFSSYIGGPQIDYVNNISLSNFGTPSLYICGRTSTPLPSFIPDDTQGTTYNKKSNSGSSDGFVLRMELSDHSISWGTLFGGNNFDKFTDLVINPFNGNIILCGQTLSSTNESSATCPTNEELDDFQLCSPAGAYTQQFGDGTISSTDHDIMIVEFTNDHLLEWSTYFGGPERESGSIITSNCKLAISPLSSSSELIFGITTSVEDITTFPHATVSNTEYQHTIGSSQVVAKFVNREYVWSTGVGCASQVPTSKNTFDLTFDKFGNLLIVGATKCDEFAPSNEYCQEPSTEVFPICQSPDMYFQEDNSGNPLWGVMVIVSLWDFLQ